MSEDDLADAARESERQARGLARDLDDRASVFRTEEVRNFARAARLTLDLAHELIGFPRHLSQHVGGFLISRGLLGAVVPLENAAVGNRPVVEWDKDDLDTLGTLQT